MTRGIALLCLWLGAFACRGEEAARADSAVGHVVSVQGTATATRPDEPPRALAAKSAIFADDLVATAETSEVTIVLKKNGATLKLANGTSQRVSESLAWKAPSSQSGGIGLVDTDDSTHIAGEPGDRPAGTGPNAALDDAKKERDKEPSRPEGKARDFASQSPGGESDDADEETETKAELGAIAGKAKDGDKSEDDNSSGSVATSRAAEKAIAKTSGRVQARKVAPRTAGAAADRVLRKRSKAVGQCLGPLAEPVIFYAAIKVGDGGVITSVTLADHSLDERVEACVVRVLSRDYPASLAGASIAARASFKKAKE